MLPYCHSRFVSKRRPTREVRVGTVGIGGSNPIRVQSMTTTPTQDVAATIRQVIALVDAGCEIVRITAQNIKAARALGEIRSQLQREKIQVPLVADIHFLPQAAMEAACHVDKVRINPGNYADRKRFAVREYSDVQYNEELERLFEAFTPIVRRCREYGRAMRIGTNHGSLSDRIMNRFGDTPLGMVESALEFIRICEAHSFHDIVLSMKASNPKVMIQAYRLAAARMDDAGMDYPLHLGVTEAGDGEDARVKSAIGIGSLLADGLGDTIRVSLTEDPVYEVPVARELAMKATTLHDRYRNRTAKRSGNEIDPIDPYSFRRRLSRPLRLTDAITAGASVPPRVVTSVEDACDSPDRKAKAIERSLRVLGDTAPDGFLIRVDDAGKIDRLPIVLAPIIDAGKWIALELGSSIQVDDLDSLRGVLPPRSGIVREFGSGDGPLLEAWTAFTTASDLILVLDVIPETLSTLAPTLNQLEHSNFVFTCSSNSEQSHSLGSYRALAEVLHSAKSPSPVWIRSTSSNSIEAKNYHGDRVLESSILIGGLSCDGIGDIVSIEGETDLARSTTLSFNVLQGARARISKAEIVACPSCGRTLFDLETTTQKVRAQTAHLKGVTIAVMGCIVNGPGEMADADFGYVGGAPGKVNLYVGKECVQYHIAEEQAVDKLIDLIKGHGKWVDADAEPELQSTNVSVVSAI